MNKILERIHNSNKWPAFKRSEFLEELNVVADDSFKTKSVRGYLAALLIYHQLCEEMLKILIDCCTFFIQLVVYPREIEYKSLDKKMFGQLIDELEKTISFDGKKNFISQCRKLNNIRIRIVHKLTRKTSLKDIEKQTRSVKNIFDDIYKSFDKIYDNFRVDFHSISKNFSD